MRGRSKCLRRSYPEGDDLHDWALLRAALANAYMATAQFDKVRAATDEILRHPESPKVAVSIARGYTTVLAAHSGGPLGETCDVLVELGDAYARQDLPYFAAVSYHNAGLGHLARGRYSSAAGYARRAIDQLDLTPGHPGVESTHALAALALWELGHLDQAEQHMRAATLDEAAESDALADVAWILGVTGAVDSAWLLLGKAARAAMDGVSDLGAHASVRYTRVLVCIASGNLQDAASTLEGAWEGSIELDSAVRHKSLCALVALLLGRHNETLELASAGLRLATEQGAGHWEQWLRLIEAVASSDRDGFRRGLLGLLSAAKLSTLALADVVVMGLPLLDDIPPVLEDSIVRWPDRWLPAIRASIRAGDIPQAQAAAQLLARFGTVEDVPLLSAYERTHVRMATRRVLGKQLARHANPTLVLHDLGRIAIDIGQRHLLVSQSRRRTASLLAFLASRLNHSATKEQVLESLWPNQSPAGAANSLHQTLFYLRRDIDPWFNEAHSVHYLVVEPDLVYLDHDLVQVDSSAFLRQAAATLLAGNVGTNGLALLRDYTGSFAPEFAYEDWSMAWRDRVHSTYLHLAQRASEELIRSGDTQQGIDVIARALVVDPTALDLEASLILALLVGSNGRRGAPVLPLREGLRGGAWHRSSSARGDACPRATGLAFSQEPDQRSRLEGRPSRDLSLIRRITYWVPSALPLRS